jgi:branched-chain amino acid transport system permease protein
VLTFLVAGLVAGGVYAIASVGLVLTYSSSRVFNFAHGALAFFIAVTFYELAFAHGLNKYASAGLAVFVISPLIGLFLWAVLFRRLTETPPTVRLVATVGLFVAIQPLTHILYGTREIQDLQGIGPYPHHNYKWLGVPLDSDQLIAIGVTVLLAIALFVLLRYTAFGLSMRATVDAPVLASTSGINTTMVTAGSWMIGTTLAGISGVLLAPIKGYSFVQFTFLILGAFAGVVIAKMHSLPLAFFGALLVGVAQNMIRWEPIANVIDKVLPEDTVWNRGLQASLPFIIMLIFLVAYRDLGRERFVVDTRRAIDEPEIVDDHAPEVDLGATDLAAAPTAAATRRRFPKLRVSGGAVVLVVAWLFLPVWLTGTLAPWLGITTRGVCVAIILLSYTVVAGEGGMISLCQITFAGIGGVLVGQFIVNQGMSVLAAAALAVVIVVPIGVLAALPSLRLGDLYVALATLAFAELVQNTWFQYQGINNFGSGVVVPRPKIGSVALGGDAAFFRTVLIVFVIAAILVRNLQRSTTGLTLAAMRSSEPAAATTGISVVRAKLVAFGVSAAIAAVGGAFFVQYARVALPQEFLWPIGLVWLAIYVTWGVRSRTAALIGGLLFALLPYAFDKVITDTLHWSDTWLEIPTLLFGLGAIGLAREPRGALAQIRDGRRRRTRRRASKQTSAGATPASPEAALA